MTTDGNYGKCRGQICRFLVDIRPQLSHNVTITCIASVPARKIYSCFCESAYCELANEELPPPLCLLCYLCKCIAIQTFITRGRGFCGPSIIHLPSIWPFEASPILVMLNFNLYRELCWSSSQTVCPSCPIISGYITERQFTSFLCMLSIGRQGRGNI